PVLVIQVTAGDPGSWRYCGGEGSDSRNELRRRLRVTQLHRREVQSAGQKVNVRVDESRHDHAAVRIDHTSIAANELADLGRGPDRSDAITGEGDCLRPRTGGLA